MPEPENKPDPGQGQPQPQPGQGGGQPGEGGGGEPTLYKLPDGREVSAEEVLEEYNKLLPDYTRKSQLLAKLTEKSSPETNPWQDPNYRPQSWEEILSEATKRAVAHIEGKERERSEATEKEQKERDALNAQIDASVAKIKQTDKELDENDMFAFAAEKAKKGVQYTTVESLYEDYKAIREARKQGQIDAQKNIQRRQAIDTGAGKGSPAGGGPIALESIRSSRSIIDVAREKFSKMGS